MRRSIGGLIVMTLHLATAAAEDVSPAAALARVRAAVGYEALRRQTGDVALEDLPEAWRAAMQDYLNWETDLLPRIKRDGALQFERFRPRLAAAVR